MIASMMDRQIVITRPSDQANRLAERLRAEGARPILFPAIEIHRIATPPVAAHHYDIAIFISANAVNHGLAAVAGSLDDLIQVIAVGSATAASLHASGVAGVRAPIERFDSEGVLAMAELAAVTGKRVLIVRGIGGRTTLADALRARGALVDHLECYERRVPVADPRPLLALWGAGRIDAVSFTSTEGITNFRTLIGPQGRAFLLETPAFVPHPRIGTHARSLGMRKVIEIEPGDDGLITGMRRFFATVESNSPLP